MKIQQLSSFFILFCCLSFTYNAKSYEYQQRTYTIYTNKDLNRLHSPVLFSSSRTIEDFFRKTYNRPEYAQEVLPNDFSHLLQFLEHGNRSNKKRIYSRSIIRIFANKLKTSPYVNAYAFDEMLPDMIELLTPQIESAVQTDEKLVRIVYDLLYSSFSSNFSLFKQQPHLFLDDLSQDIIEHMNECYTPVVSVEELRSGLIRFLEIILNKLIWHPEDGVKTWNLVKSIADHLADFVESDIIADTEDLNDLYISLVERYIFFLDINVNELPIAFYRGVKEDIATSSTVLLELEEQEEFIEPKAQRLIYALNRGQARALAQRVTHRVR